MSKLIHYGTNILIVCNEGFTNFYALSDFISLLSKGTTVITNINTPENTFITQMCTILNLKHYSFKTKKDLHCLNPTMLISFNQSDLSSHTELMNETEQIFHDRLMSYVPNTGFIKMPLKVFNLTGSLESYSISGINSYCFECKKIYPIINFKTIIYDIYNNINFRQNNSFAKFYSKSEITLDNLETLNNVEKINKPEYYNFCSFNCKNLNEQNKEQKLHGSLTEIYNQPERERKTSKFLNIDQRKLQQMLLKGYGNTSMNHIKFKDNIKPTHRDFFTPNMEKAFKLKQSELENKGLVSNNVNLTNNTLLISDDPEDHDNNDTLEISLSYQLKDKLISQEEYEIEILKIKEKVINKTKIIEDHTDIYVTKLPKKIKKGLIKKLIKCDSDNENE